MDSDRKSTVSSFYGGRKSSIDALNNDFPSPLSPSFTNTAQPRPPKDSSSSFYNPDRNSRGSVDLLNHAPQNVAGYNSGSYSRPGREEPLKGGLDEEDVTTGKDDVWDVYADFNNAGPRYSSAFGGQNSVGYQKLNHPAMEDTASATGPVEMVTVPALGPEWKSSEMREMTKAGRREKKNDARQQRWTQWKRDERGICGKYLTRRFLVYFLFSFCVVVGILLAFTIPRMPSFAFNSDSPLGNATGAYAASIPTLFSRAPANFSFPAVAQLQLDTGGNYLPLTFNHLRATIIDTDTNRQVASGDLGHHTVPAKSFPNIQLPLNFTYVATNDTDPTWVNWYSACKNPSLYTSTTRPGVNFRLILEADIAGLPGTKGTSTNVVNAGCPIQLPLNSA